jgi:putative aldouronate transport system permease protein
MMIKNYFQSSIPEELLEAARIDGASEMKIFLKIVIPLSKPILATVALIVGLAYWNDWQNGLYYLEYCDAWHSECSQ